jgi:transposase
MRQLLAFVKVWIVDSEVPHRRGGLPGSGLGTVLESEGAEFARVVFVGDRGMVTQENLKELLDGGQGYLVGVKRRGNAQIARWLDAIDVTKWIDCPVGISSAEKTDPPRTRVQEVLSGKEGMQVFVIDSDERRAYEESMRGRSMDRVREKLEKLRQRVEAGRLSDAAKIGAAAERIMQAHHGYRYYRWQLDEQGRFSFEEDPLRLEQEKRIEGKYLIATSEASLGALEAVRMYKELSEVERGFRCLKDVLEMRPIYHKSERRVRAHIFVAVLALLLTRVLERRLKEAGGWNIQRSAAAGLPPETLLASPIIRTQAESAMKADLIKNLSERGREGIIIAQVR